MNPKNTFSRRKVLSSMAATGAYSLLSTTLPGGISLASAAADDAQRKKNAKYHMIFGSPYPSKDWKYSPHMHQEIKKVFEEMTNGNVYVEIIDEGKGGVGTDLMSDISRNVKAAGLVSVSNLTPVAPQLDILNIPFWMPDEQAYVNLITSKAFDSLVFKQIRDKGRIDKLFTYHAGFRTATTTVINGQTIKVPSQLKGATCRIPPSKTLGEFYNKTGAIVRKIPWKKVSEASASGSIDVMDPCIVGLYSGPNGLREHLGVISKINSVYDGWIAVVSQEWMKSLDSKTKDQVMEAADTVYRQHLKRSTEVINNCEQEFIKLGVKVYEPTADEKAEWVAQCGYELPHWDKYIKKIVGSKAEFEKLIAATQSSNGYTI